MRPEMKELITIMATEAVRRYQRSLRFRQAVWASIYGRSTTEEAIH